MSATFPRAMTLKLGTTISIYFYIIVLHVLTLLTEQFIPTFQSFSGYVCFRSFFFPQHFFSHSPSAGAGFNLPSATVPLVSDQNQLLEAQRLTKFAVASYGAMLGMKFSAEAKSCGRDQFDILQMSWNLCLVDSGWSFPILDRKMLHKKAMSTWTGYPGYPFGCIDVKLVFQWPQKWYSKTPSVSLLTPPIGFDMVLFLKPVCHFETRNVLALVGLLQFRDAWPPAGPDRDKAAAARYLQQQVGECCDTLWHDQKHQNFQGNAMVSYCDVMMLCVWMVHCSTWPRFQDLKQGPVASNPAEYSRTTKPSCYVFCQDLCKHVWIISRSFWLGSINLGSRSWAKARSLPLGVPTLAHFFGGNRNRWCEKSAMYPWKAEKRVEKRLKSVWVSNLWSTNSCSTQSIPKRFWLKLKGPHSVCSVRLLAQSCRGNRTRPTSWKPSSLGGCASSVDSVKSENLKCCGVLKCPRIFVSTHHVMSCFFFCIILKWFCIGLIPQYTWIHIGVSKMRHDMTSS